MGAVTIMEIVLLIASVICFTVSFLIPEKKPEGSGIDQELAKEEVKEMVRQEVEACRGQVEGMVKDSVDYAMENAELSLERLTNEKIMAINEYSDSVMQEIHKNHEEVVFLYDMLINKHDSLKKTVAEASRAAKVMQESVESIQSFRPVAVSYGEGSVRIAPLASKRKEGAPKAKNAEAENPFAQESLEKQEQLEREAREDLRTWKPELAPYTAPDAGQISLEAQEEKSSSVRPIFGQKEEKGAGQEEEGVAESIPDEAENGSEGENARNNNEQILALHKQGLTNVQIAQELGLGVGEVKLVIDLFQRL